MLFKYIRLFLTLYGFLLLRVLKFNFLEVNNSRDAKAVGNINRRRVFSNSIGTPQQKIQGG
jgi:hypothetical protein